jgi:N-methylhydantoinase A
MLDRARMAPERRRFERSVDARYERQSYELSVPVPSRMLDAAALAEIAETFHDRHRATYGHDNRAEPVQLVSARLTAVGAIPTLLVRDKTAPAGTDARKSARRVWFRDTGEVEATIWNRARMPAGLTVPGPAVIESLESTILVPPAWQATMNDDGCVLLTRAAQAAKEQVTQ